MKKIIDYKLIQASSNLTSEVKKAIDEGWQPYGSVAVVLSGTTYNTYFYQPMVKYEKES